MAKVLLIDDHADIRQVFAQIMEMNDHDVECISASTEAMRRLHELRPDVVVADQNLPDLSGLELLREIRANHSFAGLYVVLCSGDDSIKDQALEAGAQDFWTKGSDAVFDRIAQLDDAVQTARLRSPGSTCSQP
jgi:two-component system nitrate/nitrite response regulator NarL